MMKRSAMLFLLGLAACAQGRAFDHPSNVEAQGADPVGPWELHRSSEAGISVALPCEPTLSVDPAKRDPRAWTRFTDRYGGWASLFTLQCTKLLGRGDVASFRITRTTFPSLPGLARQDFEHYMDLVRSEAQGHYQGPRVMIAGEMGVRHIDYVLKQQSVRGDLGLHDFPDRCMWNFYGLNGESVVQAVMFLPKRLCPTGDQPVVTEIAAKFLDSISSNGT